MRSALIFLSFQFSTHPLQEDSLQDVLVPLTAPMILSKKTTLLGQRHYEETRTREVDKNLVEASTSKDPAAGTLRAGLD